MPGQDGIPIACFQQFWPIIGYDFHQKLLRGWIMEHSMRESLEGLLALSLRKVTLKTLSTRDL